MSVTGLTCVTGPTADLVTEQTATETTHNCVTEQLQMAAVCILLLAARPALCFFKVSP